MRGKRPKATEIADFIHELGIAGSASDAISCFLKLRDLRLDFLRIVPGSRDMDPAVAVQSLQAIAQEILSLVSNAPRDG